jgi:hypothetical protein
MGGGDSHFHVNSSDGSSTRCVDLRTEVAKGVSKKWKRSETRLIRWARPRCSPGASATAARVHIHTSGPTKPRAAVVAEISTTWM